MPQERRGIFDEFVGKFFLKGQIKTASMHTYLHATHSKHAWSRIHSFRTGIDVDKYAQKQRKHVDRKQLQTYLKLKNAISDWLGGSAADLSMYKRFGLSKQRLY